jgi:hypothetical protein
MFVAGASRRQSQSRATGWAGLALLVAVAVGLFGQGAYYPPVQRSVGVLIAVATVLSLAVRPPIRAEAPVRAGGARAGPGGMGRP